MFDPADPIKRVAECASEVMPLCGCKGGGVGAGSSFVPGTEVLTPDGKVAIENLREGDLVVARHEVTGELGEFPITSLMAREAPGVIWLTLEDAAGKTSKLGVTDEHPLFVVGKGWTKADRITQGEQIKDSGMEPLNVAAVDFGVRPLQVHNLEIAGAWTYFVGDLEAWGHNASWKAPSTRRDVWDACGGKCTICGKDMVFKGPRKDRFSVGHIKSRKNRPDLAEERSNLQGECCSCNARNGSKNR